MKFGLEVKCAGESTRCDPTSFILTQPAAQPTIASSSADPEPLMNLLAGWVSRSFYMIASTGSGMSLPDWWNQA